MPYTTSDSKKTTNTRTSSGKKTRRIDFRKVSPKVERHPYDPKTFTKPKQVALPKSMNWLPKLTEFSHQFNDFNPEWRNKRFMYSFKGSMIPFNRHGAQAQGFYKHDKEKKKPLDGTLKFRKNVHFAHLEEVDLDTEEQRDLRGAEVRGFVKLNKKQGARDVRQNNKHRNRGMENHKGYYAHGNRWKAYVASQVKADGEYKKMDAKHDGFSGLSLEKSKRLEAAMDGNKTKTDDFGI